MKTALVLLALLVTTCNHFVRCQSNYDSDEESRGASSSSNCVFVGCSCGEEDVLSNEAEYGGGNGNGAVDQNGSPYGLGYDVICTIDDSVSRDFPERDTSKKYASFISSIELTSNGLSNIPDDRFDGLEISVADFSKNDVHSLSPNVFRGIQKLEVLDLSENKINSLSAETFQPLAASLIQLKLNHNQLAQIDTSRLSEVLSVLGHLKTLILRHNQLVALPDLSRLTHLEEINLAYNELASLTDANNNRLLPSSVSDLNLENNRLTHITANTFAGLANLKYLNLENNQIALIDEQAFSHLTRLTTLNLGKNKLKHIPSHIFATLVNLDRLDLSAQDATLKEIDDFAFDRSSNTQVIRRIDLSRNRIAKIGNKAFCSRNHTYPYVNIKDIDLGGNQLTGLNACILRQLSKGFSDFQALKLTQTVQIGQQSKPRLLFKPAPGQLADKLSVRCDCEVTRALSFVDLEGQCESQPDNMVELKNYQCGTKQDNVEEDCASKAEFDCAEGTDRATQRPSKPGDSVNKPGEVQKGTHSHGDKGDKANVATKSPSSSVDSAAIRIQSVAALFVLTLISSSLISF